MAKQKEKTPVRLTVGTRRVESQAVDFVRATVKDGGKTVVGEGLTEDEAIKDLRAKLKERQDREGFRAEYPKTVEVEL